MALRSYPKTIYIVGEARGSGYPDGQHLKRLKHRQLGALHLH
jgi:hypothetical protein